jgi:hypothetical protein
LITHSQPLRLTVRISFLGRPSWYSVHAARESRDRHAEMMVALDEPAAPTGRGALLLLLDGLRPNLGTALPGTPVGVRELQMKPETPIKAWLRP